MAVQVGHPQGPGKLAEVAQQKFAAGQVAEPAGLLLGDAREKDVLEAQGTVHQGYGAVAGPGQGTGRVQHTLQHPVVIQVLGDAEAGAAEPGEPLLQVPYPPVSLVGSDHLFTSGESP